MLERVREGGKRTIQEDDVDNADHILGRIINDGLEDYHSTTHLVPEYGGHNPTGIAFFDATTGKECRYVTEGHFAGWVVYLHPDGQWVTLKQPSNDELERIGVTPGTDR